MKFIHSILCFVFGVLITMFSSWVVTKVAGWYITPFTGIKVYQPVVFGTLIIAHFLKHFLYRPVGALLTDAVDIVELYASLFWHLFAAIVLFLISWIALPFFQ